MTVERVKEYLCGFNEIVRDNTTVVSRNDLGQEFLYHISTNPKIDKFVPSLTQRAQEGEDRSVPRVSTAPSILGCIMGYIKDREDWTLGREGDPWQDGWYIYGFSHNHSVRPSDEILPGASATGEHWLVPYDQEAWEYPADIIGSYYYRQVHEYQLNGEKVTHIEAMFLIEFNGVVRFSKDLVLTPGYWSVTFKRDVDQFDQVDVVVSHRKLTTAEGVELKGLHADLLSYTAPPSAGW